MAAFGELTVQGFNMTSGKFTVKQIIPFSDLIEGKVTEIGESDLCFQTDTGIIQLVYTNEHIQKFKVKPGFYKFTMGPAGIGTSPIEFRERVLLEEISSTASILKEARTFFKKLHLYDQLGMQKKRGVLLYSSPGCGKSSSIEKFCLDFAKEDPGTVVLVWPTSDIESDSILHFFTAGAEYAPECTRVILIMEDIGGGEPGENRRYMSSVDSGMLNLLDGVGLTFRLPTFIVATTNHPEILLKSLADRPGRFDLMLKLNPPTHEEKIKLMEFITKRTLSDEEKECLGKKGTEEFSVAHLEEIAIRALLHDKTHMQVVQEMIDHSRLFNNNFEEKSSPVGFGY